MREHAKQGTQWPPAGSGLVALQPRQAPAGDALRARRRLELALAVLSGGVRHTLAALVRRALLAAGWLLAAAKRQPLRFRRSGPLPTLRRWHIVLACLAGAKLLQLSLAALRSLIWGGAERRERQRLKELMLQATNYSEWSEAAVALDALTARTCQDAAAPRQAREQALLSQRAGTLAAMRERGDAFELCAALRLDYMRHAGDITNNSLLEAAGRCPVVPPPVQRYIDEVKASLQYIAGCPEMALDDRLAFLRELRHAYGRTGLVLSGGGSLGFWHFGVVKALLEANMLPRVVSGSSAGSIGGALLCTHTNDEVRELVADFPTTQGLDFFANNTTNAHMRHLIRSGYIQDHDFFQGRLRRLLGDLTFLDAYQRSGRILNISVTAADTQEPSRLLNYLSAPNVLIWSAVACSSAFPLLFAPQDLLAKDGRGNIVKFSETGAAQSQRRWCDGSLEEDLPMRGLSQQFGCNFFITSQCNPYVVPVVAAMSSLPRGLARMIEVEFKHRCQQLLKIWPTSKFMKLLCQPWEGDINLCLPYSALPVSKSAVNFTPEDIFLAMKEGQRAVWAKLPAIQAACAIEVAIDEQLSKTTRKARQQARLEKAAVQRRAMSGGMRGSLPSWLHIPSLGLPPVESALSLATTPNGATPNGATPNGVTPSASATSLAGPAESGAAEAATAEAGAAAAAAAAQGQQLSPSLVSRYDQHQQQAQQQQQTQQPGASKQPRTGSRLRRGSTASSATANGGSSEAGSLEGSRRGGTAASTALAAAAAGQAEQAAADAGVQATAGQLLVATIEAAAEALPELEAPGTPTAPHELAEAVGPPPLAELAAAAVPGGVSEAAQPRTRSRSWSLGAGDSPQLLPLFESPRAAWADLALLSGIAAAGEGVHVGLDVFDY